MNNEPATAINLQLQRRLTSRLPLRFHLKTINKLLSFLRLKSCGCISFDLLAAVACIQNNNMNRRLPKGPAAALGLTTSITLFAIYYSHYQQVNDKAVMRAGVDRDKERLRRKREEK
jgi:hypothetical protein